MKNRHKNMQDKTPAAVVCAACGAEIIPASRAASYRERDIQTLIQQHKCSMMQASDRDPGDGSE